MKATPFCETLVLALLDQMADKVGGLNNPVAHLHVLMDHEFKGQHGSLEDYAYARGRFDKALRTAQSRIANSFGQGLGAVRLQDSVMCLQTAMVLTQDLKPMDERLQGFFFWLSQTSLLFKSVAEGAQFQRAQALNSQISGALERLSSFRSPSEVLPEQEGSVAVQTRYTDDQVFAAFTCPSRRSTLTG